jgi:uncharacterized protein (DUF433 family)
MIDYKKIISINPNIRFGKPCIRNTRISVFDILSWLASGMTHAEILEDYPELQKAGLKTKEDAIIKVLESELLGYKSDLFPIY